MDHEQLSALFALLRAFPQERHYVDMHGQLSIVIPLTDEQEKFFRDAQEMFRQPIEEPADAGR